MNYTELDVTPILPEHLGCTKPMWSRIVAMLVEDEYIKGVHVTQYIHQSEPCVIGFENAKITKEGLQYLEENSMMKKCANAAKGIIEAIL